MEVQAPYGYVLDSTPVKFNVTKENSTTENAVTVIKVNKSNIAQKGKIIVNKTGERFYDVTSSGDNPVIYQPVYKTFGEEKTSYVITAAEPNYDIYSAGNCKIADNYHRVKELNQIDKITAAQTEAMKYGAFHGWDKPEANPANYNEIGVCLILNHPDR